MASRRLERGRPAPSAGCHRHGGHRRGGAATMWLGVARAVMLVDETMAALRPAFPGPSATGGVWMHGTSHFGSTISGPLTTILSLVAAPGVAHAVPTEPGDLEHELRPAEECKTCHLFSNAPADAGEPLYAPFIWQGTMMANAARDPVFWAGVAVADSDHPDETIECIRCHSPSAFLEGRGESKTMDDLIAKDFDGVTCDICHRMVDDGETPPGNARYVLDDVAVGESVPRRGPWAYVEEDDMKHEWIQDVSFIGDSRACGTCHDVTTPRERVDDSGLPMGRLFNEQRTYSEWLGSAFAVPGDDFRSCQDCHMVEVADVAGCVEFQDRGQTHATGARRHDLVGANRHMIEIMQAQYGTAAGGPISDTIFNEVLARTDDMLAAAASLEVGFPSAVDLAAGISDWTVTVTNESGHKLPTGYSEGRVMWLEVTATYNDERVYSSGYWDGMAIEADDQVRRYEAIAQDYADGATFHLLRNNHWVLDNRLAPRGLAVDVETDPVGDRYALTPDNTWPHVDDVSYAFEPIELVEAGPDVAAEVELSVRLLYLVNTPDYLDFLADEGGDNGSALQAILDEHGRPEPMVLAQAQAVVPLSGLLPSGDDDDATGDDDDATGDDDDTPGDDDDATGDDDDVPTGDDDDDATTDDPSSDTASVGEETAATGGSGNPPAGNGNTDGCGCRSSHSAGERGTMALVWLGLGLGAVWRRRAGGPANRRSAASRVAGG
ncbi:MAG: hypothetical protein B7733_18520 [Myxococcales bacterium FL481]|nr:MAG: hypothetical protein B7733_18520 [Myxococcales bacterium FL481]